MSPALRPATVEAIASFRRRRTKLLRRRACIAAIIVLLLLLLVVALLDRATFMPDQWRMGLSYFGYGVAIIAAWRLALRFVKEANAEEGAAVLLEKGDPALHEKLLSAVELSHESKTEDSEEFRGRLQDDVAGHLTGFDAKKVLPNSLLWPWVKGLCAVILVLVGLSFVPGLHLPGFMARAALPFANIGRPSSTKVRIVQPAKADALVPIASSVPVGVQIEGKIPKRVLVETLGEGGKRFRTELSSAGANRYEGSVGIGQSSVKYRVIAGDAITAWHTLDARPRPRIVEFSKTITPPSYTGLPARTLTEDHGDISALEGSTVKLTLKPNQAISESAATLLPDATRLEMRTHQADSLGVDLPVNGKSDSWQLALKSKETGFNNEESAPWRIETLADVPPSIAITDPKAQMEVQVDDTVPVSGSATDDIGLAKIELSYAINATGWKATTLKEKAGKETTVTSPFKLAPLPVKTGDSVLVKLIATDLKGQTAESAPVRLFIVENKLNLAQREWAAQQRLLAQQAQALNEEMRDLRKEAERVRATDRQKQRGKEQEDADAALAKMKQSLASVQERSEELWEKLKETAQQAPDALKAMDANLGGQKLAEMRGHHLKELQEQAQAEKIDERQLKDAANRAAQDAEQLSEALRAFAAADTAQAVKESMEHLAPQQNRLADKAMDANRNADERPKWQEQQRAALAAAQNAKKDLENLKEVMRSDRQRDVNHHIENFARKMPALEASLDKPQQTQSPEYVYGQSHEMRNAANQARDASRAYADETAQRANEQRDRLMAQQNPALAALDQARDLAQQASNKRKEEKNEEPRQQQAADKLTAAARQMKDQSEMREQNHQTNHQTALDQNRMGRALDGLADQMKHAQTPEEVKQIAEKAKQLADAARALEADAKAQDAANSLQQAEEAAMAKTQQEQQLAAARAAASQLKDLPRALQQAQARQEAVQTAHEAVRNAQWQRDETQNQQRNAAQMKQNGQQPPNIPDEQNNALKANANAQQKLAESMEHFAPKVAEARKTLEGMTPKLSELAKNAAQDVKQSQQQTEQVAKAAENNQPAQQTAQDANALMPKANQDGQKLSDLQAALRQEADKADLTSEAQRQMARTADVGLAQMRQQTPQIAQNLQQAAKSQETTQQAKSLQNAAKAQQQTAQGLEQLAKNLAKMEQGEMLAQDALDAQQAMEEALGIKQPLDQAYSEAENLAKLMEQARENPNEALAMLEKELKQNPQMQRALGVLAEQTAQESQQALAQAKDQPIMAQPAQEQEGHDLARVARHEDRLEQKAAAQQVGKASQQIQQMAKAAKADPAQNTPQNAQQAAQAAQEAQQAASEAAKSQVANTPAPKSFLDSAKGALLAQALDQIDQVLNLSPAEMQARQQQAGQPQSGQQQQGQQQGQQPGQQSSQQQAQQNLAQANQAQAQSMAQARAQGMVPGQQPQQQQANQQGKNQEGQGQASQDATGNLAQTQAQLLVPVVASEQGGDWGHLPSRMAKDLTEASRQELSPEYRAAIESYYKAISEKAKK